MPTEPKSNQKEKQGSSLPETYTLSKNVVESYIFATSRQNLSIYSERLLLCLIKAAQCQIFGLNFKDGSGITTVDSGPLSTRVEIQIRDLLGKEGSKNYAAVKRGVRELISAHHEHEEIVVDSTGAPVLDKAGNPVFKFEAHTLVNDIYVNHAPGVIAVEVNNNTWKAILDFSKGYKRYDLLVAMKLSSVRSLRLLKLISNQKYPMNYTIEDLKDMWGLGNKYKKNYDIIKIIEQAKQELDSISSWTFTYEPIYSEEKNKGKAGRKAITSIRFYPVHQLKFESLTNVTQNLSPIEMFGKPIVDRLVKNLNFSIASIKSNSTLFTACKKYFTNPSFEDFLIEITPAADRANNCAGYTVNACKKRLREKYGLVMQNGEIVRKSAD